MDSFRINSEDNEFNSRVDALLSSLQTAAATVDLNPRNTQPNEEDEDDNREDGFRKPTVRPHRWRGGGRGGGRGGARNTTPDYVKNPRKWTRYNMKDTPVLSDRENKQEGLRLFDKLRSRRLEEEAEGEVGGTSEAPCPKITFKKPTKVEDTEEKEAQEKTTDMTADALFGGTKRVRKEEYVVGVSKKRKPKKNSTAAEGSQKEEKKTDSVKLGYLMFEDEEEDE